MSFRSKQREDKSHNVRNIPKRNERVKVSKAITTFNRPRGDTLLTWPLLALSARVIGRERVHSFRGGDRQTPDRQVITPRERIQFSTYPQNTPQMGLVLLTVACAADSRNPGLASCFFVDG